MAIQEPSIKHTRESVKERLHELGLTTETLTEAVRAGEFERASCTELDPKSAAGFEAWRWGVRRLREQLIPKGWRAVDDRNLPLVVHPVKAIAIAVTSGDESTGLPPPASPSTLHGKGPATETYVKTNRRQLLLFGTEEPRFVPTPKGSDLVTWLLLVHAQSGIVRLELSLPASIDEDGYINSWRERILLPSFRLEETPMTTAPQEPRPVDVTVTPKVPK